jgi:hypothetical protein
VSVQHVGAVFVNISNFFNRQLAALTTMLPFGKTQKR